MLDQPSNIQDNLLESVPTLRILNLFRMMVHIYRLIFLKRDLVAVERLNERMEENSLEIAVYNGRTDLFNPCVAISSMIFSPETPAPYIDALKPHAQEIQKVVRDDLLLIR